MNKEKEEQRRSREGPQGGKRARKAKIQGTGEATTIAQLTASLSTYYRFQPRFQEMVMGIIFPASDGRRLGPVFPLLFPIVLFFGGYAIYPQKTSLNTLRVNFRSK